MTWVAKTALRIVGLRPPPLPMPLDSPERTAFGTLRCCQAILVERAVDAARIGLGESSRTVPRIVQ